MVDEDPFEDLDDVFRRLEETLGADFGRLRDVLDRALEQAREGRLRPGDPFVTGFTVRMGPDGPEVDEFGSTSADVDVDPDGVAREPVTDIIEAGDEVTVTVEIPGVTKDDIDLTVAPTRARIHVDADRRRYFKTVDLPASVDPDSTKATYRNGVLDIAIKKAGGDPGKHIDID